MKSPSQTLVHQVLAAHLRLDEKLINDTQVLEELGLDPLDLVLVVIRLQDVEGGSGEFPFAALAHATTVGDLVLLADLWLQRDTLPGPVSGQPASRVG